MNESPAAEDEEIIACLLSERELAIRGDELARALFSQIEEIAELPDGCAYRFAGDGNHRGELLECMAAEGRCCPFLTFALVSEAHSGPLWLRLRGSLQVKAFIAEAFTRRGP